MNSDHLLQMSDGDLKKMILNLRSRIKEIESSEYQDLDTEAECKDLQTHYCYVYRALEYKGVI